MRGRDWIGFVVVVLAGLAMAAYRNAYVEPRTWGLACAAMNAPAACLPREALLWMQQTGAWGGLALTLGLAAIARLPFPVRVAAVAAGICAVMNYNATFGVLGASLGAWAWLTPDVPRATPV